MEYMKSKTLTLIAAVAMLMPACSNSNTTSSAPNNAEVSKTTIEGSVMRNGKDFVVSTSNAPGQWDVTVISGDTELLEKAMTKTEELRAKNQEQGLLGLLNPLSITVRTRSNGDMEMLSFQPN